MDALDVKCPFCGAEPGNGCIDPKTGQDYPPHRGRVIAAQHLQDAPSLRAANASAVERQSRQAKPARALPTQVMAPRVSDEPPIALGVTCPNCGAEAGQPCVDNQAGEPREAPCRIRKQAALGHPTEGT